jgi:hypothetical protein
MGVVPKTVNIRFFSNLTVTVIKKFHITVKFCEFHENVKKHFVWITQK